MNIDTLKAELTDDLLTRGYAGMTDAQAAADLNTAYRSKLAEEITSAELFEAIDSAEFVALTDAQQSRIDRLLGLGTGIKTTTGSKSRAEVIAIFGGGSTTVTDLVANNTVTITRAAELSLRVVKTGHVAEARK